MADTSKYTKQFITNIQNFSKSLDAVVDTFEQISAKQNNVDQKMFEMMSQTHESMQYIVNDLHKLDEINTRTKTIESYIKDLQKSNTSLQSSIQKSLQQGVKGGEGDTKQIILDRTNEIKSSVDGLKDDIKDIKKSKEKGLFNKISDKDNKKGIMDGIKLVVMIAVGVAAIGLALQLVGGIDFVSVMALALALPFIAYSFAKIAEIENFSIKKILLVTMGMVTMSIGMVAASIILSKAQMFNPLPAIMVGIVFSVASFGLAMLAKHLDKIKIKSVLLMPLVMPVMSLAISLSSNFLQNVKPIPLSVLPSILIIGLSAVAMGYAYNAISKSKFSLKALAMAPLILVAMSIGIAASSLILQNTVDIPLLPNLKTALVIGLAAILMAPSLKMLGEFKPSRVLPIALLIMPALAAGIVASSIILQNTADFTTSQMKNAILVGITMGIISLIMTPTLRLLKPLSKLSLVELGKLLLTSIALSGAVVASSYLLQYVQEIEFMTVLKASLGTGVAALAMAAVIYVIKDKFKLDNKEIISGSINILTLSTAAMLASHIIALGDYSMYPNMMWTIGTGLAIGGMALIVGFLSKAGIGIKEAAIGAAAANILALGIVGVAWILELLPESSTDGKGGAMTSFVQTLGDFFKMLVDVLAYAVEKMLPLLKPLADGLGYFVNKVIKPIGQALVEIVKGLAPPLKMILEVIIPPIERLLKLIIETLAPYIKDIINFLLEVVKAVKDIISVIGDVITNVVNAFAKVIESIGNTIVSVIRAIVDTIDMMFKSLIKLVEMSQNADASKMVSFAGGLLAIAGAMLAFGASGLIGLITGGTLSEMASTIEKLALVSMMPLKLDDFVNKLGILADGLTEFADKAPGIMDSVSDLLGGNENGSIADLIYKLGAAATYVEKINADAFKSGLIILAEGLMSFIDIITSKEINLQMSEGFFGDYPTVLIPLGVAVKAAEIVDKVTMDETKAMNFKTGMNALAQGVIDFSNKMSNTNLNIQMSEGFFSDYPTILIPVGIALEAANLVETVSMDETKANNFKAGMTALAQGVIDFADRMSNVNVDIQMSEGFFSDYPTIMIPIGIALEAANLVESVSMDQTKATNFTMGMKTLADGIIGFATKMSETKLDIQMSDGFFSDYPTILIPVGIAKEAAALIKDASMDEETAKKYTSGMTALGNGVMNFSLLMSIANGYVENLDWDNIENIYESITEGFVELENFINKVNPDTIKPLLENTGMGIAAYVKSLASITEVPEIIDRMSDIIGDLKDLAEIQFNPDELNKITTGVNALSNALLKMADSFRIMLDTVRDKELLKNFKDFSTSLLSIALLDEESLDDLNEAFADNREEIAEIMKTQQESRTANEGRPETTPAEDVRLRQEEIKRKAETAARNAATTNNTLSTEATEATRQREQQTTQPNIPPQEQDAKNKDLLSVLNNIERMMKQVIGDRPNFRH